MHRPLLAAIAITGLAAATPAIALTAAPAPADTGRMAVTDLVMSLPSGDELRLDLRAAALSAGPRLLVNAYRCTGNDCVMTEYASSLTAGALSVDESAPKASLAVQIAGRALLVTWRPDERSGATVGGGTVGGNGASVSGSDYFGSPAKVSVEYDGQSCTGDGAVGDGVVVDSGPVAGDESSQPLDTLALPDGAVLGC